MDEVIAGVKIRWAALNKPVILTVGLLSLGWLLNTPAGLLGKADAVGYAVCHRIPARSFLIGDRPLSLCARCTGMYLGAVLGLLYQGVLSGRRAGMPPRRLWVVLVLLVGAFGFDGLNSYLHLFPFAPTLYEPQNWLRLVTGTGMGIAIAIMLYPAFNQTVWRDWSNLPAIGTGRLLAGLMGLGLLLDLVVLTQNPLVLYPLSLVSAAGVLALLTMVYSMVWIMLLRLENRFYRLPQLLLPLVGGFGAALFQIVVLDLVRYFLTGSWDGFHFG